MKTATSSSSNFTPDSKMDEILRHPVARAIVMRYMPDLTTLAQQLWLAYQPLRLVASTASSLQASPERLDALYAELAAIPVAVGAEAEQAPEVHVVYTPD